MKNDKKNDWIELMWWTKINFSGDLRILFVRKKCVLCGSKMKKKTIREIELISKFILRSYETTIRFVYYCPFCDYKISYKNQAYIEKNCQNLNQYEKKKLVKEFRKTINNDL